MKRHSVLLIGGLLAAAAIHPLTAQGQTGSVRGIVTEETSRQPLPGVTVTIGARVTQTRPDGQYVIRGVAVPAGRHRVEFRYAPVSWRVGWIVSLLAGVLIVVTAVAGWRRRAAGAPTAAPV